VYDLTMGPGVRIAIPCGKSTISQGGCGYPEMSCCSVNCPRVFGMLADWAVIPVPAPRTGWAINLYAPGELSLTAPAVGTAVGVSILTEYPRQPKVTLKVKPAADAEFELWLRIPAWSKPERTTVSMSDGVAVPPVVAGSYLALRRRWPATGTTIDITLVSTGSPVLPCFLHA